MSKALAYLCSRYPATSHTFILREILELRRQGFSIFSASINRPDRPNEDLDAVEKQEAENTFYIKANALKTIAPALLAAMKRPKHLVTTIFTAARMAGWDLGRLLKHAAYLAEAMIVSHWMTQNHVRHIHVHFANAASTVGLLATSLNGGTYSLSVHGPDIFYNSQANNLELKFTRARFVSCISDYCRSQLMLLTPQPHWNKYVTCRLGVDTQSLEAVPHEASDPIPTIVTVGRLVRAKGQHILIDALAQLASQDIKVRALLIGDGPERQALLDQVRQLGLSGSVVFCGAQPPSTIPQYLSQAKAFVLPSFAEGIPVSLMEAMAAGVPCISTHINGIPELIRNEVDGILVPPADPTALAHAISRLLRSEKLAADLAQSAQQRVANQYNLATNSRLFSEILVSRSGIR